MLILQSNHDKCERNFQTKFKAARCDFNTTRHSATFHTQDTRQHHRFILVKLQMFTFAAIVHKQLPKLTQDWLRPNLADMTHFQVGPRFCEMKTVNKAHIGQTDWVIRALQSCGHASSIRTIYVNRLGSHVTALGKSRIAH